MVKMSYRTAPEAAGGFRPVRGSRIDKGTTAAPGVPEWGVNAYRAFADVMEDPAFPCMFARHAHKRDSLLFLFADAPSEPQVLQTVRAGLIDYLQYVGSMQGLDGALTVLNVMFRPAVPPLALEAYHRQAWDVLQYLHDNDPHPWPADIPTDPDDPLFSFCFAGVPLFINVSCPAHRRRRSRNLGPSLVLVLQPRHGFDGVGGAHVKGDEVRKKVRALIEQFDGQPAAPELGTYSRGDNREWWQYALPEDNRPRTDRCPLRIDGNATAQCRAESINN
jgi:FPC/CPF motif-containing protein YcgG